MGKGKRGGDDKSASKSLSKEKLSVAETTKVVIKVLSEAGTTWNESEFAEIDGESCE